MRRVHIGPSLGLAFALAIVSVLAAAPSAAPISAGPLRTAAVNFSLNYSDPASDVAILYTSNNSHVADAAGNWLYSNNEPQVNILRIFSVDAGSYVVVYLRIQGGSAISSVANTSYELHLYTRSDNSTSYIVRYSAGVTTLRTNHTGSATVNETANTTTTPAYQLGITLVKTALGNITMWNMDATAKMVGSYYTFQDFGWLQPGNPGSAPAFIQGKVTDVNTNVGLANATVTTGPGGYLTTTNATGYYVLPAAPGTYNLTFSQPGYQNLTEQVTVSFEQTQTVNAKLSPAIPPSEGFALWLWVAIAVVLFAVIALILVLVVRRRQG